MELKVGKRYERPSDAGESWAGDALLEYTQHRRASSVGIELERTDGQIVTAILAAVDPNGGSR